jgi:hypothetical protein
LPADGTVDKAGDDGDNSLQASILEALIVIAKALLNKLVFTAHTPTIKFLKNGRRAFIPDQWSDKMTKLS